MTFKVPKNNFNMNLYLTSKFVTNSSGFLATDNWSANKKRRDGLVLKTKNDRGN